MLSLIRMPFVALSLLLYNNNPKGETANKSGHINYPSLVSTGKKFSTAFAEKYNAWQLDKNGISFDLFTYAMKGYEYLSAVNKIANKGFITIIDFSKPSTEKRLFVIDTHNGTLLFKTLVAHGRNSGAVFANQFSNAASSFASSLGFYTTADVYTGKHGVSLKLNGCEKGFNDNAYKRAVVMHGADYVSENFIQQNGFLGRSHGCPAVPTSECKKIIDVIKSWQLFVYLCSVKAIFIPIRYYQQLMAAA